MRVVKVTGAWPDPDGWPLKPQFRAYALYIVITERGKQENRKGGPK